MSTDPDRDLDFRLMRLALRHARRGLGTTSPNPAVGAVVARGRRVLAVGHHRQAGGPHAEVAALQALRSPEEARGATVYVTLEPCSTHGRTPPCTDALLQAGVGRVVVGATDPNPRHRGRGLALLRAGGVEVRAGVLEPACTDLNVGFNRWIVTGRPWVIAKYAQSLDGQLVRPPGEPPFLTGERARLEVQRLRATVDAVLVGAETVRKDDPQLTVRIGERPVQPWRVVVTRSGALPPQARLFTDEHRDRTLVYAQKAWLEVLDDLGRRGVTRLLVEGGGIVLGELHGAGLIDEVWAFFAPLLTGGTTPSVAGGGSVAADVNGLIDVRYRSIGDDFLVRGKTKKPAG